MKWIDLPPAERTELARQLTERQLHVYILRLGGYSWTRISQDCGIQIRTVRTHHHAAQIIHQQIRNRLEQEAA